MSEEPKARRERVFHPARPLSRVERDLISYLLASDFHSAGELREQIDAVSVLADEPDTGSLSLIVDESVVGPASTRSRVPVEGTALAADGGLVHVLLHVDRGYLAELDVFREDGEHVAELPTPSAIDIFAPG